MSACVFADVGMPPDMADMPSASVAFSMMFGERPQEEVSTMGWFLIFFVVGGGPW